MKLRFHNAHILTMKDENIIEGELCTQDGKITYVGPSADNKSGETYDREIDCDGNLLMPSFKNAHTHTAMVFARSLADEYKLDDWLHKAIFPREARLTPEHIYWFTLLGMAEYISGGITAAYDMYFHVKEGARAAKETGMRYVLCGSVNDFGGMDRLEDEFVTYNSYDELVSYTLGFHAEYTTSPDIMKKIAALSQKYQAPVSVHMSETADEVEGCISRYGNTPAAIMDELHMFDYGGTAFHCVWLRDEDYETFRKRNISAVFNACSNLKLASGMAPVYRFLSEKINIGIGTDGAGSNNALDMFREMYLCATESNILLNQAATVRPYDILSAASSGSAKAMGLKDCDVLAPGKLADFILLDMNRPNMHPVNNIISNIIYSANPSNVSMTVCNGRILYENGSFNTLDISHIYKKCEELMETLR